MEQHEVGAIFHEKKAFLLRKCVSSKEPLAIFLGGQQAAGKSSIIDIIKGNYPERTFLVIDGDAYRQFHPDHDSLIPNPGNLSEFYQNICKYLFRRLNRGGHKKQI